MKRITLRICFGIVVLWLLHMGFFAKRGWIDWRRISKQSGDMEEKIRVAREQKEELLRQAAALQNDTAQQERMVRQVLGYVRPHETVIEFE